MNDSNTISVIINTYNASKFLARVLKAVSRFDEVIVCDMESTDDTVAIALQAGARVVTFPKGNHQIVEPARDFAIHQATSDWVLVVDADEIVTPALWDYLYKYISKPNHAQGLYIPRQNRFMNVPEKGRPHDYQLRFFVRKGTTWPPIIHTIPKVPGRVEYIDNRLRGVMLEHLAENYLSDMMERCNRYTDYEVSRRLEKHYSWMALLWRPLWRFSKAYFLEGKIRRGITGFIDSVFTGYYQFVVMSKIIEYRLRQAQEKSGKEKSDKSS